MSGVTLSSAVPCTTIAGGIVIGLLESFASFYASSLKDAIVFAAIIPIVLWRWLYVSAHSVDEEEDD